MISLIFLVATASASDLPPNKKPAPVVSASSKVITVPKGAFIAVETYDPATRTYHLKRPDRPQEEPLDATPEAMTRAIHSLSLETMLKRPRKIIGNQYSLDSELVVLFRYELQERRTKFSSK